MWWFAILISAILASTDVCLFFYWKGCSSQVASTAVRLSQEAGVTLGHSAREPLGVLSAWN